MSLSCLLLSAFCFLSPPSPAPVAGPGTTDTVRIESSALRVGFDASNGRLLELVDRESSRNLLRPASRGGSPGVVPPAIALQKALGQPVSVYWHWWHHAAYDTGFPDYLPPREGVDSFTTAIRTAHAAGIHAMVYMNQRLWCTGTPNWTAEHA